MGWEIVREKHPNELGQWSRLWLSNHVQDVLAKNTGTQVVEGIVVDMRKQQGIVQLNGKSFSNMGNLRLLKISNVQLSDDLEYLPNELRLLKWRGYPLYTLPSSFEPKKLFELNMCYSNIKYLWKGEKVFEKLKAIKMCYSRNLIVTPNFTMVPNLERLDLEGSEILECFRHWSEGDEVKIGLSPNWFNDEFIGFVVFAVISNPANVNEFEVRCSITIKARSYIFGFAISSFTAMQSDHLWLGYLPLEEIKKKDPDHTENLSIASCIHSTFLFIGRGYNYGDGNMVKRCGIRLVYNQDLEHFDGLQSTMEDSVFEQNHDVCIPARNSVDFMMETPDILKGSIKNWYNRSMP
ncbi:hypothetical protein JRO89_XS07G0285300 [Xanthoceras sorbifolium]|uniref:C-JID domain-containing protein n=1 Tax=Xanthoceras sorbifolium TaxID=99658 RepID=A0ABQ8HVJ2_9ROSI|nr:hypothetical protein JRO89_XS07G0285300 [Xanthoceras sorbifolium]